MRRALVAVVAAIAAALCYVTPAHAFADDDPAVTDGGTNDPSLLDPATTIWWPKTNCDAVGASAQLCLDVYSKRLAGGGLSLDHVYLRIKGGFWESHAYDCDYVEAWNDDAVIRWKRDDNACDIEKAPPYTLFHPRTDFPQSAHLAVRTCGYPHLDKEVDPGRTCVTVHVP